MRLLFIVVPFQIGCVMIAFH